MSNNIEIKNTRVHDAVTLTTSYQHSTEISHSGMNQLALNINYTQDAGTGFAIQIKSVNPAADAFILLRGEDSGSGVIACSERVYETTIATGKYQMPIRFLGEAVIISVKSLGSPGTDAVTIDALQAKV